MQIEINGKNFDIGRIDARKQMHVVRRIAPALQALGASAAKMKPVPGGEAAAGAPLLAATEGEAAAPTLTPDEMFERRLGDFEALAPVAEVVAKMSDADVDYVINACLAACRIQQGPIWAPVMVGGSLMFQDLTMPDMLRLAVAVIMENLGGFFGASRGPNSGPQPRA